jgi:glycosyltransferase involved in cell wall biosynthesis
MRILFLGETYRADAQTWISGIQKESGITLETMEIASANTRMGRLFQAILFFRELLKSRKGSVFDLVLAERATSYGFFSLFVKAKVRIVAQQGITDAFPEKGFSGFYKRRIQNLVYNKVDLIHAWGNVMVEAILESGTSPTKILVKPKGIDLNRYYMRIPGVGTFPSGIVTRSLADVYRHEVILDAIAALKKQDFYFFCNWVGDGPSKNQLIKRAKDLGIEDRVKFFGRIPNRELPSLLTQNPVYLSMPLTEGVSSSLFEAMASGCLPIVTDLRANRQFIHSYKNGVFVPVDDAEALAAAIKSAVQSYPNFIPGILANRKWIEDHADLRKNMSFFLKKYQELLRTKTSSLSSGKHS